MLGIPCQTTSKTGTQHHPLAERLPKIRISSQIPQNTPPDAVLPTRKPRSSLIHQKQAPVPSTRKPTQPTEPTLPTGGRHQKQWEWWTCRLWKGDPKHSKLSKIIRQRNTQQMKEQSKNPLKQKTEEQIVSIPEKQFRVKVVNKIQNLVKEWRKYNKRLTRT